MLEMRRENQPTAVLLRQAIIAADDPFVTIDDLAEALEVTARTVRNHIDEAAEDPRIRSRDVGQTTVYYGEMDLPEQSSPALATQNPTRRSLIADRGEWKYEEARYYRRHPYSSAASEISARIRLYYSLKQFAKRCGGLKYTPGGHGESQILVEDTAPVSEEDVRYMDGEVEFFAAPWVLDYVDEWDRDPSGIGESGEVYGISGLLQFGTAVEVALNELVEEADDVEPDDVSLENIGSVLDAEELREIYPAAAELAHAGTVIESFTKRLHGLEFEK